MIKMILSTSVIFLVIVAVRRFFREKAGNVFLYSLWLLFVVGLVVPVFSLCLQNITKGQRGRVESPVSIMNLVKTSPFYPDKADAPARQDGPVQQGASVQPMEGMEEREKGEGGKNAEKEAGTENAAARKAERKLAGGDGAFRWMERPQFRYLLGFIWAAGAIAILLYQLLSERSFRGYLIENREEMNCQGQKLYVAKGIPTPLLFRGKGLSTDIYLPETIIGNETLVKHAVLHESVHRRHGDIWWGYIRNFLVALYWFYPLVWVAAILSKRDCEYACDSTVMEGMDRKERISYGNSLLSLIQIGRNKDLFCTATAMKIGKSEMEVRIRMIQRGRKRNIFVMAFIFLLLCVAGTAAFTDAMEPGEEPAKGQEVSSGQPEEKQPGQGMPEEGQPEQGKVLSARAAEYKITDFWGADMPYICYEDDERMIFTGCFGLFVYSRERGEIVQSLNLEAIGCHMTQGDHYCQVDVSEDGKIAYLHVLREEKMYQYSIDTNELQYVDYKLPDKLFNWKKWKKTHKSGIQSARSVTIGDLLYYYEDGDRIKYEPLFYKPYGSCEFWGPEDIRDLSEVSFYVNGKEYVLTEKKKLQWIEKHFSDSAEEIEGVPACPFYRMMYLKREDGRCGKVFPATDSCSVYQSGEAFYDYNEKTSEGFWRLFGIEDVGEIK